MIESPYSEAAMQKATTEGPIHQSLDRLESLIDKLDGVVGNLQARATPILTPDTSIDASSPSGQAEVRQPDSPIAERIGMLSSRLQMHIRRIDHLTGRIQV